MNGECSDVVSEEMLETMNTDVLRDMLDRETDVASSKDVNCAFIKEITTVLNARMGVTNINVDTAYEEFISEYLECEMLFPTELSVNADDATCL